MSPELIWLAKTLVPELDIKRFSGDAQIAGALLMALNSRGFILNEEQNSRIQTWMKGLESAADGASGGRYSYTFTPTRLGTIIEVKDNVSGKTLDLTDYEM